MATTSEKKAHDLLKAIRRLKFKIQKETDRLTDAFARKCDGAVRRENAALKKLLKNCTPPEVCAQEVFDKKMRRYDLKEKWAFRAADHAYVTALFAAQQSKNLFKEQRGEELLAAEQKEQILAAVSQEQSALAEQQSQSLTAKQSHEKALQEIENKRAAYVAKLQEQKRKYVEKHAVSAEELQRRSAEFDAARELAAERAEKSKQSLLSQKEEKLLAFTQKNEAKIAEYQRQLSALQGGQKELPQGSLLSVENLCMYFGGLHAVENLSFDVKKGELFGLIGPNGAGKTTVFNCITQFYKPTKGEIYFENKEGAVVRLNDYAVHDVILEGISRTFQNVEVIKELTVLENLMVAATRYYASNIVEQALHMPILATEEKKTYAQAVKVLEFLGLSAYKDRIAFGLPYGILKKTEIARALMTRPKLVILDEPAAGLNDRETQELATLIKRIRDEYDCTILLVEHDMSLVMGICDRICAISFGKMLAIGTAAEIKANKQVQEAYLGTEEA